MMASSQQPPNKPDHQTAIGDTVLAFGEVFLMRLPFDMLLEQSTDPLTWTTTSPGPSPPPPPSHHPCVLISNSFSRSTHQLRILVLRSFQGREPREVTALTSDANSFLPLPFPGEDLSATTPPAFGRPLSSPDYNTLAQTWLYIHPVSFTTPATTRVISTHLSKRI